MKFPRLIGNIHRFLSLVKPKHAARVSPDYLTIVSQPTVLSLPIWYTFAGDNSSGDKSSMVNIGRAALDFSKTISDLEDSILLSHLEDKDTILHLMQMSRLFALRCTSSLQRYAEKTISDIDQILASSIEIIMLSQSLPYHENPFRSLSGQLMNDISSAEEDYIFQRKCPLQPVLSKFLKKYRNLESVLGPQNASVYQILHLLHAYLLDLTEAASHPDHPPEEVFLLDGLKEATPILQASINDLIHHLDYLQVSIEQISLQSQDGIIPVYDASVLIRGCIFVRDQLSPTEGYNRI